MDNDHDAVEDVSFEFRFQSEIRLADVFTVYVGAGAGIPAPANSPAPVAPGTPYRAAGGHLPWTVPAPKA